MLALRMKRASGTISDDRFEAFVSAVSAYHEPLLNQTLATIAKITGATATDLRPRSASGRFYSGPSRTVVGEIFRTESGLVVAALTEEDELAYAIVDEEMDESHGKRTLQVAEICPLGASMFLEDVGKIAEELFAVELEFFQFKSGRLDELRAEGRETGVQFTKEHLEAARVLADRTIRTLAVAIKSSGGLLISDLAKQLPAAARDAVADLQARLEATGLVQRDVVVICKKSQAQINRVPDESVLAVLTEKGVRCACGRVIGEERRESALGVTDLGRLLLDGSRWFSILLVEELHRLGVPAERILVEQESGGDELDCIADVSAEVVFFELKDKEFNLGNAYSFGAKMGIVRPRHPVIVTTEHVGNDAKDHFARARSAAGSGRYRTYGGPPEDDVRDVRYIEGLENLRSGLEGIIGDIYRRDAAAIINEVMPLGTPPAAALLRAIEGPAE